MREMNSNFEIRNNMLIRYSGVEPKVTIPDGIQYIGYEAFLNCKTLQEVVCPENVVDISCEAFRGCSSLERVIVKGCLENEMYSVFGGCKKLKIVEAYHVPLSLIKDCEAPNTLIYTKDGLFSFASKYYGMSDRFPSYYTNYYDFDHFGFWACYDHELLNNGPLFHYSLQNRLGGAIGRLQSEPNLPVDVQIGFAHLLSDHVSTVMKMIEQWQHYEWFELLINKGAVNQYNWSKARRAAWVFPDEKTKTIIAQIDSGDRPLTVLPDTKTADPINVPACALCVNSNGYVEFGSWLQNDSVKTPIEWKILETKEDRVLLISRFILDYRELHSGWFNVNHPISWKNSSLREWLNSAFLYGAFSAEERALLNYHFELSQEKSDSPLFPYKLIRVPTEKVSLLTKDQAQRLFSSDRERACMLTEYTRKLGAPNNRSSYYYWLRDMKDYFGNLVTWSGALHGKQTVSSHSGVRPVIILKLANSK